MRLIAAAFGACGALHVAYMVKVGGDYIHARLLLPGFFALCVPVSVVPLARRQVAGAVIVPWAVVAIAALRPAQYGPDGWLANGVALPWQTFGNVTTDDFGWGDGGPRREWYDGPGVYVQVGLARFERIDIEVRRDVELPVGLFSGVGIVGYSMGPDFHILDILGLADTLTAHLDNSSSPGLLAGHEKPLPAPWIAALLTPPGSQTDPGALPASYISLLPPTEGREFQEQVAWARAALRCDDILRLRNAASAPLTPGRFVYNALRSPGHTSLRIPPDPEEAYHRFCGPGTPDWIAKPRE